MSRNKIIITLLPKGNKGPFLISISALFFYRLAELGATKLCSWGNHFRFLYFDREGQES